MAAMRRFAIALMLALYVGVAPFALGGEPVAAVGAGIALVGILFLVRRVASESLARGCDRK